MAALTTTAQLVGWNGIKLLTSGSLLSMSTATTSIAITVGALERLSIFAYNPVDVTNQTITVTVSTAFGQAQNGRSSLTLTTALGSSDYVLFGNFESNWFASSGNVVTITATTTILMAAWERSSTRQN